MTFFTQEKGTLLREKGHLAKLAPPPGSYAPDLNYGKIWVFPYLCLSFPVTKSHFPYSLKIGKTPSRSSSFTSLTGGSTRAGPPGITQLSG